LLDRGWDAYWILAQPLYVLVRYVDALGEAAKKETAKNEDGSSSRRFVVDKAARQARQAAREQAQKEKP
jgi:hypothetical protein